MLTLPDERNQLNMGLFNIKLQDPDFYSNVHEDTVVVIDKDEKTITIEGYDKVFHYHHSPIEETLLDAGGVLPLYGKFGTDVFRQITGPAPKSGKKRKAGRTSDGASEADIGKPGGLEW